MIAAERNERADYRRVALFADAAQFGDAANVHDVGGSEETLAQRYSAAAGVAIILTSRCVAIRFHQQRGSLRAQLLVTRLGAP